jgi:hypothetical protein
LEHQNAGGGACPVHRWWQRVLKRLQFRWSSVPAATAEPPRPRGLHGHLPPHRSCNRGQSSCSVVRPSYRHKRYCWSHFLIHLSLFPYQFFTSLFLKPWIPITELPKQTLTNGFKRHCNGNALQSTEPNALLLVFFVVHETWVVY